MAYTSQTIHRGPMKQYMLTVKVIIQLTFRRSVKLLMFVKWPGSTHDAFIWRQSGINMKITNEEIPIIDGWLLGDSGYPLRPNLMTPLLSPATPRERRYNRAFLKSRKTIECTFGIWKSRWRSMDKTGGSCVVFKLNGKH